MPGRNPRRIAATALRRPSMRASGLASGRTPDDIRLSCPGTRRGGGIGSGDSFRMA